jgi:hypothetical protein
MHISEKYNIKEFWCKHPEKLRKYMSVEQYTRLTDECDGVLLILDTMYKVIGEDQVCGMITMRVEKLF